MRSDARTPVDISSLATWRVSRASQRAHRLLVQGLSAASSRGYSYRILSALREHGTLSQTAIGLRASIDGSDLVRELRELDDLGLVERVVDPIDRRRNLVAISPAGITKLTELDAVMRQVQEQFLAPVPPEERTRFLELLAIVEVDPIEG